MPCIVCESSRPVFWQVLQLLSDLYRRTLTVTVDNVDSYRRNTTKLCCSLRKPESKIGAANQSGKRDHGGNLPLMAATADPILGVSQGTEELTRTPPNIVNDTSPQDGSDDNDCPLAELYHACLDVLSEFHSITKNPQSKKESSSNVLDVERQTKSNIDFTDVLESFVLWGDIVRTGKAQETSITFPTLYKDIARLLLSTGKAILKTAQHLHYTQKSPSVVKLESWVDKAGYMFSASRFDLEQLSRNENEDHRDSEGSDANWNSANSAGGESDDTINDLKEDVSLLMELLPSISRLAALDWPLESTSSLEQSGFEASLPARLWISQVADKYVRAAPSLVNRLGEANWQRFCRLRIQKDADLAAEYGQAKSIFRDTSTIFRDSAVGTSLASAEVDKHSVASHSSFASSNPGDSQHSRRVPPEPPEIALGEPFLCLMCHSWLDNIRNRIDWK